MAGKELSVGVLILWANFTEVQIMVKLSAFPKCYVEDICSGKISLFDWIEMATELEPDGLELYSGFLESYDSEYLSKVRNSIAEHGFQMPMMCYSPDFTLKDVNRWQKEVEKQKEIIRVTAELEGKFCRVLSGQKRPGISEDEGVRLVVEAIQSCLPVAEEYDVTLVMENHYKDSFWRRPEFAQKKHVFLKIVDQMDSPYFGIQFDPSNSIVAGEDPIDLLQAVKHRVKTMHASDRYLEPGTILEELKQSDGTIGYSAKLLHGITGKGLNDYDKIFSILKEVNFHGWISIEDGMNGMEEMKASLLFLKEMRKKYLEDIPFEARTRSKRC